MLGLQPRADTDLVRLHRDDAEWAAWVRTLAPVVLADFESVRPDVPGGKVHRGAQGLRELSLDWLAPWVTYRSSIEDAIDCGERVLTLQRSYGRLLGSTREVALAPANVWTVLEGKLARVEYFADRTGAIRVVGLSH